MHASSHVPSIRTGSSDRRRPSSSSSAIVARSIAGFVAGSIRSFAASCSLGILIPLLKSDALYEFLVPWITAQWIVARIEVQVDQPCRARLIGPIERPEGAVEVADRCVPHRQILGAHVMLP